jgi:hypothetical protein
MENYFNYLTQFVTTEEVITWFEANNIVYEKLELFNDFSTSLYNLIKDTYLGDLEPNKETKITLSDEDNDNHFQWCWDKTLTNFKKENIVFDKRGEHFNYFKSFFTEIYYSRKEEFLRQSVGDFFEELFSTHKPFTRADLDMISTIYKNLDKHIKK